MKPQIYHVDAFTSEPCRGNSAGVVLHADTLSDAQMQLIARELRHSETAFLLKSEESDVRIRYFTPTVEVPICGHATVAAHYVRATVLGLGNTTVWQTSLAGRHRVEIHAEHNDYRITLEQGQPSFEPPLVGEIRAAIITALNLTEDDIVPGAPIQVASTGHAKVMILLKPDVDIDALSPNLAALTAISQQIGCNGFFPFQIRPGKNETDGRMFSPAIGIVEDPVTGNANGPMGAWLVHHGLMAHDGKTLQIQGHQGRALGKEGTVDVTVTIRDNQPDNVTISGQALTRLKKIYPDAALLVHPESPQSIVEMADAVGSTSQLIKAAETLPHRQLIVATDRGIFYKMQQAVPEKELLEAPTAGEGATCRSCAHCPWMAMNGLKAIAEGLEQGGAAHEIQVEAALREGALLPLNRMLDFATTLRA